jgi:hypothetical protein
MHVYSIITIVNHDLESMRETREEVSMHGESACLYLCYMLVDTCMCGMGKLGLALQPVFSTQSPTFSLLPHPTFFLHLSLQPQPLSVQPQCACSHVTYA